MGEMMNEGQAAGDNFDLTQFYQIFFEEAGENLDQMEQMLLQLDLEKADDEELNAIFRCAHSIKGGAATFGFADVAELTHQMESLLDKLRRHELQPTAAMVDVLLESSDALRLLLARHQGRDVQTPATHDLVKRISVLANGSPPEVVEVLQATTLATAPANAPAVSAPEPATVVTPEPAAVAVAAKPANGTRDLEIHIGPLDNLTQADGIAELFRDITGLGQIETLPCDEPGRPSSLSSHGSWSDPERATGVPCRGWRRHYPTHRTSGSSSRRRQRGACRRASSTRCSAGGWGSTSWSR